MLTVADRGDEAFRGGTLCCPVCQGDLRPWGYARLRLVRHAGGGMWVRPRRARCRSCGRTQVLLPCQLLRRRRDAVSDVGVILEAYANRTGYRRAAVDLAIPVPTVRNWIRRLRGRWPSMVDRFDRGAPAAGRSDDPPAAIAALRRAAARAGQSATPWEFASLETNGDLLATNTT
jgi:hypothetical protein